MSPTPQIITDLVKKFERNITEYRNPKYNETLIRVEFVNPFWKALGWDVDNEQGYALAYRDVIHEDELKIGRTTRAPDYAFRVGGRRIFFLETKKPALDLKHDPAAAFQLRRYAYSAKLPVSLLTDFEELIVYNCRMKPAITDKPHVGRMMYYSFREYIEKWDEINSIFSKEAVLQGAFDRFIETKQGKRPRAEIDRDFLNDLDKWRMALARNIALRNPDLTERELNYAVQLTIDRLIFLRMCEDRDIEQYETLMALLNGTHIYRRLVQLYYKADHRYNSGLFHFEEKDGPNPDIVTPTLEIDDKTLKEIIRELYYPMSPYEFSVLPVEVLGNAYEQFLGKRITLTEGHRARIEEKPEVRKAGGVYYTPQYIVDYIVKNTVGKLCQGKTPREVSQLRILDPACGSGSFLLGAYQYLLDWHINWYRSEYEKTGQIPTSPPARARRKRKSDPQTIFQGKGGEWYLTTAEKKRILTNNIYGVDIDANAVEVTKLSLLLKVLEHETSETLNQQLGLWKERALPNLESNIKCGNSLIGTDFYEGRQAGFFNEEEALRINAFDWEREFPEIFEQGGFDAVIGNPPWGASFENEEKNYLRTKYQEGHIRTPESFNYFILQNRKILKMNGYIGVIIPSSFLNQHEFWKTRKLFSEKLNVEIVCNLGDNIFHRVCAPSCILILNSVKLPSKTEYIDLRKTERNILTQLLFDDELAKIQFLPKENTESYIYQPSTNLELIKKCYKFPKLKIVAEDVATGISSGLDKAYIYTEQEIEKFSLEIDLIKKLVIGKEINRYSLEPKSGKKIIYITPDVKIDKYPRIKEKLLPFKQRLMKRREAANGKIPWYSLNWPRRLKLFVEPKILIRQTANRILATIDKEKWFALKSAIIVQAKKEYNLSLEYLLSLLNSKLIHFLYTDLVGEQSRVFPEVKPVKLFQLPIRTIDFDLKSDVDYYHQLINLVEQMLVINMRVSVLTDPHTRELIQRQIDATDRQIDQLVYQLYGLTEEEIRIVEGNTTVE